MAEASEEEDALFDFAEKCHTVPCQSGDIETGQHAEKAAHWTEPMRHAILLMRLQRPYLVYCLFCALLACSAFLSTMLDLITAHQQGVLGKERGWIDVLEGGTWQSTCWTVVGMALVAEVASNAVMRRGGRCIGDWWCVFDLALVVLTLLGWVLTHMQRVRLIREAEEMELWLLLMRFILQPCRVFATAFMARKVQQMQQNYMDVSFDVLGTVPGVSDKHPNSWKPADVRHGVAIMEACANKGQHVL